MIVVIWEAWLTVLAYVAVICGGLVLFGLIVRWIENSIDKSDFK